jgi:type I thyroxine 5'-deiodinase
MVYIKEAHPIDGKVAAYNEKAGIRIKQPTTLDQREEVAQTCSTKLSLKFPVIVDTIDNKTSQDYAAHPDRLYLVDREGKIAYKGKPGPRGFNVAEMTEALDKLLAP